MESFYILMNVIPRNFIPRIVIPQNFIPMNITWEYYSQVFFLKISLIIF